MTSSLPNPPDPNTSRPPPRRGLSRRGWPLPWRRGLKRGAGAGGTGAAGGAGAGGRGDPAVGPGLRHGPGPPGGWGPPPGDGSVRVAELSLLRDNQGDEEPALRCRVPPDGQGEPGGASGEVGGPGGPREGPEGGDSAALPDKGPAWPAFLEAGAVLRITDADANNWLPQALRNALTDWRYRPRNPPPPQPQPPHKEQRR